MPPWFIETLKDPIFQLSIVVFIAAFAMFWWMVFQSRKSLNPEGKPTPRNSDDTIITSSSLPLTQDAKFQLILENILTINRRLDEIEKRLSSSSHLTGGANISTSHSEDINRKLDAIYKILSSLSTKTE